MEYSNAQLQDQQIAGGIGLQSGYRKPVFDIDVRSERETAYTKLSQNELMIQMYQMGAFNPQNTDQIIMMLDGMEFKGKEEMEDKIRQNGTMLDALSQIGQIALALASQQDPMLAQQLAQTIMGIVSDVSGGAAAPQQGAQANLMQTDAVTGKNQEEAANVQKARAQVQNATRPQ